MPRRRIDLPSFVEYLSILDEEGRVDTTLEPDIPPAELLRLFRTMLLAREFDERMIRLQRQGRLGTLVPSIGQEAASLGSCYVLRSEDWIVPYFRETAALLWRGWKMEQFLLYYRGYEDGFRVPEGVNDLPPAIPVATQLLHAVGLAWGARIKNQDVVVLCYFGDGATSEGDFHEALNFASVYQLPVIFLCQNNHYAISVPVHRQTHSRTLAQKSLAYDMAGLQVDGNDLLAVFVATREAFQRARRGEGPTLIEAVTYRLGVHSTADDPHRYRSREEEQEWERRDPLRRLQIYLEGKGALEKDQMEQWKDEIQAEIQAAVERFEARIDGDPLEMFDYTYAELPPVLREEKEELARFLARAGAGQFKA